MNIGEALLIDGSHSCWLHYRPYVIWWDKYDCQLKELLSASRNNFQTNAETRELAETA